MNTTPPNQDDERFHKLLREWKPLGSLPPRFREAVWHRIALAESHPKTTLLESFGHWLETVFSRRAVVVSYAGILLLVGLTTGYLQAQDKAAQAEARWRTLYLQSVDPYQVPRDRI